MAYIVAGLGNPGQEYEGTRHNAGRIVATAIAKALSADDFSFDKKLNAQRADAKLSKAKDGAMTFVLPDTFMNNSGKAIAPLVKSAKAAEKLIVIYDDFNLPLGRFRISFNRSSGGHNGVESIIKAVKTEGFVRFRIGTAPENSKGNAKTPHGDDKVEKFILGKFKDTESKELKKVSKNAAEALEILIREGRDKAMSVWNGK